MVLYYPNPRQEVQINLTKELTVPYSDSKTPIINNTENKLKRRYCLRDNFNQLITPSVNKTY